MVPLWAATGSPTVKPMDWTAAVILTLGCMLGVTWGALKNKKNIDSLTPIPEILMTFMWGVSPPALGVLKISPNNSTVQQPT